MNEQPQTTKKVTQKAKRGKLDRYSELLQNMRACPQGNWQIKDLEKICNHFGVNFMPPTGGSHYKVSSAILEGILTVPANRPVKAVYIRKFASFMDAHIQASLEAQKDD